MNVDTLPTDSPTITDGVEWRRKSGMYDRLWLERIFYVEDQLYAELSEWVGHDKSYTLVPIPTLVRDWEPVKDVW